jgi:two-component system, OmpR family, sensor histidine kinase TctE
LWSKRVLQAIRAPSLLRALVVRLTLVVMFSMVLAVGGMLLEFRAGITGIDDQSIAIQVEDLRKTVVVTPGGPKLTLPDSLRELYASPGTMNGYQLVNANGLVLESGGFAAPFVPLPVRANGSEVIMQREEGAVVATVAIVEGGELYWLRVARSLRDLESLAGQLVLRALPEFAPWLLVLVVGMGVVVVATVHGALRPLREVSRQAAGLSGDRLSERLHAPRLPREVTPLVHAINVALDRLEADYRAQREFTAHAAHELRTPLAVLRARLEARFTAEEIGDVGVEIEGLGRLVEQLLCLAQLDSELVFESAPLDAYACAVEVARDIAPLALARDHNISATTPEVAVRTKGNATLARLVFRNLIENAIQHTPPGSSILVSARDGRTVVIEDDGPGVPPAERARIFGRFQRGPGAVGVGAGLGLAIARRVMERAGGQLLLDDTPSRGARFLVIF